MDYYFIVIGILSVDLAIAILAIGKPFKLPLVIASVAVLLVNAAILIWGAKTPIAPFEYATESYIHTLNKAIVFLISTYYSVLCLSAYCLILPPKYDYKKSPKVRLTVKVIVSAVLFIAGTIGFIDGIIKVNIL